jgi:hypothetical protein
MPKYEATKSNNYFQKSAGRGPSFGSSNFGTWITELVDGITELVDGIINVVNTEEYPRSDLDQMINTTIKPLEQYGTRLHSRCRISVDCAIPSFIRALNDKVDA